MTPLHRTIRQLSALAAALLIGACASRHSGAAASPQAAPDPARCASIADSTAAIAVNRLPVATIRQGPALTTYPRDAARTGSTVRVVFRVAPNGVVDVNSLRITGSMDMDFRAAMIDGLRPMTLTPAKVGGCPAWSRGEILLKSRIETRTR